MENNITPPAPEETEEVQDEDRWDCPCDLCNGGWDEEDD